MRQLHTPPQGQTLGYFYLTITACGWAMNFTLMKLLLREWPPLFSRGLAGLVGAATLAIVARCLGQSLRVPRSAWPKVLLAAFTNVFAWMGFSTLALRWLGVGENLLLIYTMPIWATLLAWPFLGVRPTVKHGVALLLGFAGVGLLLSGHGAAFGRDQLIGIGLALGAAIFFALGTVLNRAPIPVPFVALTAWQVGLGCLPMVLLGLAFEQPNFGALSLQGAGIMLFMAFVAMALCYLTWFSALQRLSPPVATTAMLAVPVLGVLLAAVLLGEPFGLREIVALVVTLSGVALALRAGRTGPVSASKALDESDTRKA